MKTSVYTVLTGALLLMAVALQAQLTFLSVQDVQGLNVGDTVADFSAQQADGSTFRLSEALDNGPVVLMFYRGQWCPICSRHMAAVQDSLSQVLEKGAELVAVSPEKPAYADRMIARTQAEFPVLYDEDYAIAEQFGVLFLPEKEQRDLYNDRLNANLSEAHSDDSGRLPVPATYIIGSDRRIIWRHFDPDYRQRASIREILEQL